MSCDTPVKVVILPLLSLNGSATVDEKFFSWEEDKYGQSTEFSNCCMWANATQGSYLELHDPKYF